MATTVQVAELISGLKDLSGNPLSIGTVTFFENDGVTLKDIWEDADKGSLSANPVELLEDGTNVVFADGEYDISMQDKEGNVIRTIQKLQFNVPEDIVDNLGIDATQFGSGDDSDAIQLAIASASGADATVFLKSKTWDIDADLTIPTNINLLYLFGAHTDIQPGITMTINGVVDAPLFNIFRGTGTLVLDDRNNDIPSIWNIGGAHDDREFNGIVTIKDTLIAQGTDGSVPIQTLKNEDGAVTELMRFGRTSATPANDDVNKIGLFSDNSVNSQFEFARIDYTLIDVTSGTETGEINLSVSNAGTLEEKFTVNASGAAITGDLTISNDLTVTGDFTVDTDTFKVDSTNDRVVIGVESTAPDAKFNVYSTGEAIKAFDTTGTKTLSLSADTPSLSSVGDNLDINVTDANDLIFKTNNAEVARISSVGAFGIGESAPVRILHLTTSQSQPFRMERSGVLVDDDEICIEFIDSNVKINSQICAVLEDDVSGFSGLLFKTKSASGVAEKFRMSNEGNFGIQTSSPAVPLHVFTSNPIIRSEHLNNNYTSMRHSSTRGEIDIKNGDLALRFGASGNTENFVFKESGEFGIGTTTPEAFSSDARNIVISEAGNAGLSIITGAANTGSIFFGDGSSSPSFQEGKIQYDHSSNIMNFSVSNALQMTLDTSGLTVLKETGDVDLTLESAGGIPKLSFERANGTLTAKTDVAASDILGKIEFLGNFSSTDYQAAQIEAIVDGTPGVTDMPGALLFKTSLDGTATLLERMRIDNVGSVGIGLSNMQDFDSDANNLVLGDSSSNNGLTILSSTTSTSNIYFADGISATDEKIGRIIYNHNDDSLNLYTNSTNNFFILSDGAFTAPNQHNCRLKFSGNRNVNTGLDVIPAWNTEEVDIGGMHTGVEPDPLASRITIQESGNYIITAQIGWTANAVGKRGIRFRKNGVLIDDYIFVANAGGADETIHQATFREQNLLATDFIEVEYFQDSGGFLAALASLAWFRAIKLS